MTPKADQPILSFRSLKAWEAWLETHHGRSDGIWLQFHKKHTGKPSITYVDALDGALCYGWIDGQLKPFDGESWLRKFTPRRKRSGWSKRNTEHVARLAAAGKMKPAGIREVEAARADGRWGRAYSAPSGMEVPADFLAAVAKHKKAQAFFDALSKANKYAIAYRLETAVKPETRERRFATTLAKLKKGETFHP